MNRKRIELREERDFGQKFNAVFTFVQSNFKPFVKIMAFTVGPLAIVGGLFFGLFFSKLSDLEGLAAENNIGLFGGFAEVVISYLFLGIASLWMTIAVFSYMSEYEKGNENITIEAVWNRGKGKIWPVIGFSLLFIPAIVIVAFIIFALPGNENAGVIILKMLLLYIAIFYVMITLSLVIPNMVIDDAYLFESIGRSFVLIHGKWWSTFGLLSVMGTIAYFATMVFAIPFYAGWFITLILQTSAAEILTIIGACILFLGSFLMMTLPTLALGFQYFNLVERKEGTGLLNKIDQLGKPVNTANEGEF